MYVDIEEEQEKPTILVVEDDPVIAFELEDLLLKEGFAVLGPAPTVDAALGLIGRRRPDIALLDMGLRGKAATPVAMALKSRGVPFALASGNAELLDSVGGEAFAGVTNVGKPTAPRHLLRTLEALLRMKSLN